MTKQRNSVRAAAVVVVCLMASSVWAQSDLGAATRKKGAANFDVGLSLNSNFGNQDDDLKIFGRVTAGYFFADRWEFAGSVSGFANISELGDSGGGYVDANIKYHFVNKSKFVPYLGGLVGLWWVVDPSHFAPRVGGMFGVDYIVSDKMSIYIEYNGAWTYDWDDEDLLQQFVLLGFKYFF